MRINGYCCLGFVWKIIEPESASVRAGRSISQVKLRTIYYQQVGDPSKVQQADKRTGTGVSCVSSCPHHLTHYCLLCSVLFVKVTDPSVTLAIHMMSVEPLWDCPVS